MNIATMLRGCLLALCLIATTGPAWSEPPASGWEKVVFHLDETRNARWALMLARSYLEDSPQAKVAFVAYGPGVDFLLLGAADKRGNSYDSAVLNLAEKGVEFRVCNATLGARGIDKDELLDATLVVPSGIHEIARLQLQEGYAYLKP
jgi:intracellular sulfur oxidation DsrE/DsrF family protein